MAIAEFFDSNGVLRQVSPTQPLPTSGSGAGTSATRVQGADANLSATTSDPVLVGWVVDNQSGVLRKATGSLNGLYVEARTSATSVVANPAVKTTAASQSVVIKAAAGNLYGWNAVSGASAGYVMIFDSATAPVNGAVTPNIVMAMAANTSLDIDYSAPRRFASGITMVFSTTGPYTLTLSATAHLAGWAA